MQGMGPESEGLLIPDLRLGRASERMAAERAQEGVGGKGPHADGQQISALRSPAYGLCCFSYPEPTS